jgi:protein-tyrosine phosphatase
MSALKTVLARSALLCGAAAAFCLLLPPAFAQEPIDTPILQSAPNFRDLAGIAEIHGGTGYADTTANGGVMRTGVFYRSNALSQLSPADSQTLSSAHIVLDIDLRTPAEINNYPNVPPSQWNGPDLGPAGAKQVNVNIFGTIYPPTSVPDINNPYQSFVTNKDIAGEFGTALLDLAHASGPALYHCSEGKDRTGWTSMLLQTIAGVPQATIVQDYLASNLYFGQTVVQQQWLTNGIAQIDASYGSMNAYLMQGLGLTQADIYVLRAKMVYYAELPGQTSFTGNAAAGAAFLNGLQNSPLSGHYTAYNYYLQSAIDAGTLWGGETRAGGQIHADAVSYLLRQPLWIDGVIPAYVTGQDLRAGQGRLWLAGGASSFSSEGGAGIAASSEHSAGTVMGSTYRISNQASAYAGIGYNSGTVGSAGASAGVEMALITIGGRFGIASLETGPYAVARADAGLATYQSTRALGSGLGTALGGTSGGVYSGLAGAGYAMRMAPFTVTAQTGLRVTGVALNSFTETGSELALAVNGASNTSPSALAGLDVSLDRRQLGAWTIVPSISLAYERMLGDPRAESTGTLYGYTVSQVSAYGGRDLAKAGLGISAQHDAFIIDAKGNAVAGDGAKSTGVSGQLSFRYSF